MKQTGNQQVLYTCAVAHPPFHNRKNGWLCFLIFLFVAYTHLGKRSKLDWTCPVTASPMYSLCPFSQEMMVLALRNLAVKVFSGYFQSTTNMALLLLLDVGTQLQI